MYYYKQLLTSVTHKARRPGDWPITIQVTPNSLCMDQSFKTSVLQLLVTQAYFYSRCAWLATFSN